MAREKIKSARISTDLMLKIKTKYPKLMDFYNLANLDIGKFEFYCIMRGEESYPEAVTAVELGMLKVDKLMEMSLKDLCITIGKSTNKLEKHLADKDVEQALRIVASYLI